MGTWSESAGVLSLAGDGVRTAYMAEARLPANSAVKTQLTDYAFEILTQVLSDRRGSCCWEAGVDAAGTAFIRRVDFGTPAAAAASAASGLTAGVPFDQEVRVTSAGAIELYLQGSATATVSYTLTASDLYQDQTWYGINATIDAARCTLRMRCELQPVQVSTANVLTAVFGDEFWCATSRSSIQRIATRAVAGTGRVSIAPMNNKGYVADGTGTIRQFDPALLTLTAIAASAGTFPKADLLCPHVSRLWMNDVDAPQNIIASAVDDPTDVDTGAFDEGAAFALNLAKAGQIGQPVRSMTPGRGLELYIGCDRSTWGIFGVPPFGVEVRQLSESIGTTGPLAAVLCELGRVLAHTTAGVAVITQHGLEELTTGFLTDGMVLEEPDAYDVVVCRNPKRQGCHIFITPKAGGSTTHWWYDEVQGQFTRGRGGFFPDTWAERFGPRAAIFWDGVVVLAGNDGYLYYFDDDVDGSDDGEAIESKYSLRCNDSGAPAYDTDLVQLRVIRGLDSGDVTARVYGGVTAEEAWEGDDRWVTATRLLYQLDHPFTDCGRAPHLILELSNNVLGRTWSLEAVLREWMPAELTPRRRRIADAPPFPCAVPAGAGSGSGGGGGSFSGGGGSFGSGPGPGSGGSGIGSVVVKR